MKKLNKNKKGFTLVELVIVIAVIAVLAAVLIPTFSTVISKSHKSADLQEARNLRTGLIADISDTETDFDKVVAYIYATEKSPTTKDPISYVNIAAGENKAYTVSNITLSDGTKVSFNFGDYISATGDIQIQKTTVGEKDTYAIVYKSKYGNIVKITSASEPIINGSGVEILTEGE